MGEPRIGYLCVTWFGHKLVETIQTVPKDSRLLVVDTSITGWCLAKAWNYGAERLLIQEGFDVVVICNDDIVLRPDTGRDLADALLYKQWIDDRPFPSREIMVVSAYNTRDLPDIGKRWGTGPDYSCFAITRKTLETIGPFEEKLEIYFEDNDHHYRIRGSGFEALSYTPYYHYGSQTVNGGGDVSNRRQQEVSEVIFPRSRETYRAKWGGTPGEETFLVPYGKDGRSVNPGQLWKDEVHV